MFFLFSSGGFVTWTTTTTWTRTPSSPCSRLFPRKVTSTWASRVWTGPSPLTSFWRAMQRYRTTAYIELNSQKSFWISVLWSCLYRGRVTNNKHATSGYVFKIKGIKTTWLSLGKHHSFRPTIPNVPLTWTLWLFGLRSSVVLIIIALCWYLTLTPWPLVDRTVYDTLWREAWPKYHIPVHIMTSNEPSDTRPSVMISIVCF